MKAIDEITIYNPAGSPYIADDGGTKFPITDSCERTAKIMGEDCVRLVFNLKHKVTFDAFSFIEYNGQAFFLKERYVPKSVGGKEVSGTIQSARYAYDVKFVSVANMLDKFVCYRHVEVDGQSWNEPEININGTLETLYVIIMGAIEQAASRLNTSWFFTEILHRIASNGLATVGGVVQPNTDKVRLTEGTQLLTFNFSGEKIANVCTTVANNFTNDDKKDTEWYITPVDMSTYEGATLHFAKCVKDDGTARVFRDYMVERDGEYLAGELKSVDYVQEWSGIPEVIVPYGSDRNMSYRSVKAIDEITQMQSTFGKRLRLQPNKTGSNAYKFTDKDGKPVTIETDANGAIRNSLVTTGIEVVKFFDEIYPQCHFKVTSVSQKNKRQDGEIIPEYTVEAVPVDNDGNTINREDLTNNGFYPIKIEEATTLSVRFESGLLNGREFEIANKTSKDQGATTYSLKFTIVADGSIEDGTLIPSGNFIPRKEDTFALFNMKMPDEYVTYAELELAKRAYEELITLQSTRPEIKCESDETIFDEDIQFGDVLIVYSDRFDSDEPFRSRVISYSYKLSNPRAVTFNLASAIMQGTLSSMNDLIADVTHTAGGLEQRAINLSRRGWRDASEVASMLDSLTADVVLVGNGRYQFGYAHEGQGVEVVHSTVDGTTRTTAIKISHGTIEHTQEPYVDWVSKGFWEVSGETKTTAITEDGEKSLTDIPDTPLYLYAVVNESDTLLVTELTSIAHDADEDEGYLLMGILSSEFEGRRVFSRTNGYTSIEGGTITTEIIQDAGRNLIIDFQSNPPRIIARGKAKIQGNIEFELSKEQIDAMLNDYSYLKEALEQATDVTGGLISASVIRLRDKGVVTAGISGLNDGILLWGGGTYDDALSAANNKDYDKGDGNPITTLFKKDGTCKQGVFRIDRDKAVVQTKDGKVVLDDNEGIGCFRPKDQDRAVVLVTPKELLAFEDMKKFGNKETFTNSYNYDGGRLTVDVNGRPDGYYYGTETQRDLGFIAKGGTLTINGDAHSYYVDAEDEQEILLSGESMICVLSNSDGEVGTYTLRRTSIDIQIDKSDNYFIEYKPCVHVEGKSELPWEQDIRYQYQIGFDINDTYLYYKKEYYLADKQTMVAYKGMFSYQGEDAYFYYKDGVGLECKVGTVTFIVTSRGIIMEGLDTASSVATKPIGTIYKDSSGFLKVKTS